MPQDRATYPLAVGVIVSIISFLTVLSLVVALVILLITMKIKRAKKMFGIDSVHSMSIFRQNSLLALDKMSELKQDKERFYVTFATGKLEFPRKSLEWGKVIGTCVINSLCVCVCVCTKVLTSD